MLSGRSTRGATRAQPSQHSQARITSGPGRACLGGMSRSRRNVLRSFTGSSKPTLNDIKFSKWCKLCSAHWSHIKHGSTRRGIASDFSERGQFCDADATRQVACSRARAWDAAALPCAGKHPPRTHTRAHERTNEQNRFRTHAHARTRARTPRLAVCLSLRMRRNLKVHALLMKPHNDGAVLPQQVLLVRALRPRHLRCPVLQQAAPRCNRCNSGAPCCNMRTLNPLRCNTALSARSKRCSRKVCGPATEERIPFGVWPSAATTVSV